MIDLINVCNGRTVGKISPGGHFIKRLTKIIMMTSSNGNIFRVTGPLCGEFSGYRWIPLTKASVTELWCFLWSVPEQAVEQTMETPVIWDASALIMTSQ